MVALFFFTGQSHADDGITSGVLKLKVLRPTPPLALILMLSLYFIAILCMHYMKNNKLGIIKRQAAMKRFCLTP